MRNKKRTRTAIVVSAVAIIAIRLAVYALGVGRGAKDNYTSAPKIIGTVLEVHESSILIIAHNGHPERSHSPLMEAPLPDDSDEFLVGDVVTVYYAGAILETSPWQIEKVLRIELTRRMSGHLNSYLLGHHLQNVSYG